MNKNVYRSRGSILNLFLPLLLTNIIFIENHEYAFITRISCLAISILILIISNLNIKDRDLGITRYIGVGYIYITILRFLDLEKMWVSGETSLQASFIYIISYIEIINVLLSMIFYKYKKSVLILHLINVINIMFIYLIKIYDEMNPIQIMDYLSIYIFITTTIAVILIPYELKKIKIRNNKLIVFSILSYISEFLVFFSLNVNKLFLILVGLVKVIAYFVIYDFVENRVLSLTYLNAYKVLKDYKDKKILLNKRLNQRSNELNDLNALIEKSERTYYKIITALSSSLVVFEDEKVTYSNLKDLQHYNNLTVKETLNNENFRNTLRFILKIYCDEEFEGEIKDFVKVKDRKLPNGEVKKLEISLLTISINRKILLFKDITKIIEQREEIIRLEQHIKEEILNEEFHSNISHELRTPINVIYSALQLKELLIKEERYDKLIENNNVIRQNCLRLIRTIDNFIDSNKLSDNKLDYQKKVYNIVEIIENVLIASGRYIEKKEIQILFEPQYEEIYFECEKNYIERIMLNILSNSVKYGREDGKIAILINIKDENINIVVKNNNEAIPNDKQDQIFGKFTKINNSLNRPTEGSGLGLFLTKGLVELHDGNITLISKEGYGNKFIITLPYNYKINSLHYKEIALDEDIEDFYVEEIKNFEIIELENKVEIEFSDIYF